MKNMKVRVPMYFIGLFIMTIGRRKLIQKRTGLSANPVRYFFVVIFTYFYFFTNQSDLVHSEFLHDLAHFGRRSFGVGVGDDV